MSDSKEQAVGGAGSEAQHLSQDEEINVIEENLDYMNKFMSSLAIRGKKEIPLKTLKKLETFRETLNSLFDSPDRDKDVAEKASTSIKKKRSKDTTAAKIKGQNINIDKSKGAIPKTKKVIYEESDEVSEVSVGGSSSACSSSGGSSMMQVEDSSTSESDAKPIRQRQQTRTSRKGKHQSREGVKMTNLIKAMSRMDSRKVPEQEKYDEQSGQCLRKYLTRFEQYCEHNFKGEKSLWIGELERHLSGKTLDAFRTVRDEDDTYKALKRKLIEWYDDLKDMRKKINRNKFKNANYKPGESLYLYSTRLEKIYKIAYPNHDTNISKTLQEKYVSSLPRSSRKMISSQMMSYKLKDKRITWKMVQKCARLNDIEKEKLGDSENQVSEREIIINIGQEKKVVNKANEKSYNPNDSSKHMHQNKHSTVNHGNNNERTYETKVAYSNNSPARYVINSNMVRPSQTNPAPYSGSYNNNNGYYNNNGSRTYYPSNNRFNNNVISKPPPHLMKGTLICSYCGRMGHSINNCRTKWKCCYLCGAADHYYNACPQNQYHANSSRSQSVGRFSGSNYNDRNRFDRNNNADNNYNDRSRFPQNSANNYSRTRRNSEPNDIRTRPLNY